MSPLKWFIKHKLSASLIVVVVSSLIAGVLLMVTILGFIEGAMAKLDHESADTSTCQLSGSASINGIEYNKEKFEKSWKTYYSKGVLKDKGEFTLDLAKKSGISPALFAAIMGTESSWGKSPAVRKKNNPSGQMVGNKILSYPTLEAGIEATAKTLVNLVNKRHLLTVEKLGSVYAPVNADNDSHGLNSNWVPVVSGLLETFGGNSSTNIGVGCSIDGNSSIDDNNAIIAEAKKYLGIPYKWAGKSPITGMDCSGFVGYVLMQVTGKHYPQYSVSLVSKGTMLFDGGKPKMSELRPGDMVFYGPKKATTHVAFYAGKGKIIEEPKPGGFCHIRNYSSWEPDFAVRP